VRIVIAGAIGDTLVSAQIAALVLWALAATRLTVVAHLRQTCVGVKVADLARPALIITATTRNTGPLHAHLARVALLALQALRYILHAIPCTADLPELAIVCALAFTSFAQAVAPNAEGAQLALKVIGACAIVRTVVGRPIFIAATARQDQRKRKEEVSIDSVHWAQRSASARHGQDGK